jgi:hypothetical protein
MKSLLEQVKELDGLIRRMHKMESRCRSGQWIDVYRECCRIIAFLEKSKQDLIGAAAQSESKDNDK